MHIPQLIYLIICSILAYRWVDKADNKWFLAVSVGWLFGSPILGDPRYVISLGFAGIDLQPDRILFLLLLAALCFFSVQAKIAGKSLWDYSLRQLRGYEFWLLLYIITACLAVLFNLEQLGAKEVAVNLIKWATFLLVYFFAREGFSRRDFDILVKAIATFAVLSSLIGLYQFVVDEYFFRLGVVRPAFGSYFRANGLFASEYDQGVFLTIALIFSWLMLSNRLGRLLVIFIVPLGVFCTMHRASWVILLAALGMLVIRDLHQTWRWFVIGGFLVLTTLFVIINFPLPSNSTEGFLDQLIHLRLEDNTWDVRLKYNHFALDLLQKYPLGLGSYVSDIYVSEAYVHSMSFMAGRPLIVHNGFLSTGVLYGIPGLLTFVFFTLSALLCSLKQLPSRFSFAMALIMVVFILINISQDFSFLGNQIGIFLGLCIATVSALFTLPHTQQYCQPTAETTAPKVVLN